MASSEANQAGVADAPSDPVGFAVDVGRRVHGALQKCDSSQRRGEGGEAKKLGLTRRAQEFPTLAAQLGLAPALTFYMSKAAEGKVSERFARVNTSYKYLSEGSPVDVCDELSTEEGSGYAFYLAVLILLAGRVLGVEVARGPGAVSVDGLLDLVKRFRSELWYQRALMPYLIEVKRVLEALG